MIFNSKSIYSIKKIKYICLMYLKTILTYRGKEVLALPGNSPDLYSIEKYGTS